MPARQTYVLQACLWSKPPSARRDRSRPLALIRKSATIAADIPSSNTILCSSFRSMHVDQRRSLAGECGAWDQKGEITLSCRVS